MTPNNEFDFTASQRCFIVFFLICNSFSFFRDHLAHSPLNEFSRAGPEIFLNDSVTLFSSFFLWFVFLFQFFVFQSYNAAELVMAIAECT